jgi:hypothetical protein
VRRSWTLVPGRSGRCIQPGPWGPPAGCSSWSARVGLPHARSRRAATRPSASPCASPPRRCRTGTGSGRCGGALELENTVVTGERAFVPDAAALGCAATGGRSVVDGKRSAGDHLFFGDSSLALRVVSIHVLLLEPLLCSHSRQVLDLRRREARARENPIAESGRHPMGDLSA